MVKSKSLLSVYFLVSLINHLSTVFILSLYSILKVVTRPLDINQPFKTIKVSANKINLMGIPLS